MVHLRERRVDDLRRHEVGEDLLHPHVVEPLHRHQIAEPHVRRLVRDHAGAIEQLVLRRRFVEQQARGVVEDGAGVLHPAELKRRNQHDVELAERIRDARVVLEPGERRRVEVEDRVPVARHLRRIGLAVKHPERAPVARRGLDGELPRREGKEIGGQRLRLRKRRPASGPGCSRASVSAPLATASQPSGHVERQRVARLHVGLIEAGKREMRARRDEQRVEKLVVAIERLVAGGELDRRSRSHPPAWPRRNRQVTVGDVERRRRLRGCERSGCGLSAVRSRGRCGGAPSG